MKNITIIIETDFTDLKGNRLEMKKGETYPIDNELAARLVSRGYAQYAGDQVVDPPVEESPQEKRARRWFTPFGQGNPDQELPIQNLESNEPTP